MCALTTRENSNHSCIATSHYESSTYRNCYSSPSCGEGACIGQSPTISCQGQIVQFPLQDLLRYSRNSLNASRRIHGTHNAASASRSRSDPLCPGLHSIKHFLLNSSRLSTKKSYNAKWARFVNFCTLDFGVDKPAAGHCITQARRGFGEVEARQAFRLKKPAPSQLSIC